MANSEEVKGKHKLTDMSPDQHKKKKHKHKSTHHKSSKNNDEFSNVEVNLGESLENKSGTHKRKHEFEDVSSEQHKTKKKHKLAQDNDMMTGERLEPPKKKKKLKMSFELTEGNVDLSRAETSGTGVNGEEPEKKKKHRSSVSQQSDEDSLKTEESEVSNHKAAGMHHHKLDKQNENRGEKPEKKKKKHLSKKLYLKKKNNLKKKKKRLAAGVGEKEERGDKQSARDASLEYLQQWEQDRGSWKFLKVRQVWLLQHMYDEKQVDKDNFEILLKYLEPLQGKARQTTMEEAEKIIRKAETDDNEDATKVERARQIIQLYPE